MGVGWGGSADLSFARWVRGPNFLAQALIDDCSDPGIEGVDAGILIRGCRSGPARFWPPPALYRFASLLVVTLIELSARFIVVDVAGA